MKLLIVATDADPEAPAFALARAAITPPDGVGARGELADDSDEDRQAVLGVDVFRSGFEAAEQR